MVVCCLKVNCRWSLYLRQEPLDFDIAKMGLLVSKGPQKTSHPFAVVPVV